MVDYSASSSALFDHNRTVKAWCVSGHVSIPSSPTPTQTLFDTANFVDGYNLRLDVSTQTSSAVAETNGTVIYGALKFSFLTPMADNKYKIFIHSYGTAAAGLESGRFAHALNSALYPKTTDSFWIRVGMIRTNTNTVVVNGRSASSSGKSSINNLVLTSASILSSIGVVVL